jgi:hypothetical protein
MYIRPTDLSQAYQRQLFYAGPDVVLTGVPDTSGVWLTASPAFTGGLASSLELYIGGVAQYVPNDALRVNTDHLIMVTFDNVKHEASIYCMRDGGTNTDRQPVTTLVSQVSGVPSFTMPTTARLNLGDLLAIETVPGYKGDVWVARGTVCTIDDMEAWYHEGQLPSGVTSYYPLNEGTGTTLYPAPGIGSGNPNGATNASWSAAGALPEPWNRYYDTSSYGKPNAVSVKDFGAAGDGSTDDSAAFQAAVNALAGTGISLFIPAATFNVGTPISIPSNSVIVGSPGAKLLSTIAATGDPLHAVFAAQQVVSGTTTTLVHDGYIGSVTNGNLIIVASNTGISAGSLVQLEQTPSVTNLRSQCFRVLSISSVADGYHVTLDRSIQFAFKSGDLVSVITYRPSHIRIHGNGMTVTGTGDRYMEWSAGYDIVVEDINFDQSGGNLTGDYAFSFDVGSYQCVGRNLRLSFDGFNNEGGFALESAEDCVYENCSVSYLTGGFYGFLPLDAVNCSLVNCFASKCDIGVHVAGEVTGYGCQSVQIIGGGFYNCVTGITVDTSSIGTVIGCDARNCSTYGINVLSASETKIIGGSVAGSATGVINYASDTVVSNLDITGCGYGFNLQAAATLSNISGTGITSYGVYITGSLTSPTHISRIKLASTATSFIGVSSSSPVNIVGAEITLNGSSQYGANSAAGTMYVENFVVNGSVSGATGVRTGGGDVRLGAHVAVDTCAAPTSNAGGHFNRGNVTTTTTITFNDLKSTDQIVLQPNSATSAAYVSARTNGSGFTITCAASTDWAVV